MKNIILNEVKNKVIIDIYGSIGESFFEDGYTALKLKEELDGKEFDTIEINIQSLGGNAYEAIDIFNMLEYQKEKGVKVITRGIGLVASAGATILTAGDERTMGSNGLLLVHFANGGVSGNQEDIERYSKLMEKINENILNIYSQVTGKSKEELTELLNEDRWMDAKEAKKWGFLTKVITNKKIANDVNIAELVNEVNNSELPKIEVIKNNIKKMDYQKIYNELINLINLEEDGSLTDEIKNKIEELNTIKNELIKKDEKIVELENSVGEKTNMITELTEKTNELSNEVEKYQKETRSQEIEKILEDAVAKNKINNSVKENFKKLLISNFDETKELISNLKSITPNNIMEEVIGNNDDSRSDWTYFDWETKDPKGLKKMKMENEEKWQELYNKEYK